MEIQIEGYEQEAVCAHCNRNLKHGIKISNGTTVGASCFNNVLTKPKVYFGKNYRVGSSKIVELAKIAEFYDVSARLRQFGVSNTQLTFESSI